MTILEITKQPYNIFDSFQFMDVLVDDGTRVYETSIVEPLISDVMRATLPYQVTKGDFQLKLFDQ